jgi:nodulation protein F
VRAVVREDMESKMDDVASKIVEILKKHMKKPKDDIGLQTPLSDLEIESLDLAMIVFDIEDSFAIQIPYNANEDTSDFKTVGSVVERVRGLVGAKGAAA